jgi:hypothetical protein
MQINKPLIVIIAIFVLAITTACKNTSHHHKNIHAYDFVTKEFMSNDLVTQTDGNEHVMIVLIHGTILNYPSFNVFMQARKDFKNHPHESFFQRYQRSFRLKTWFNTQAINELGLLPIDFADVNPDTQASRVLSHTYQSIYQELMPLNDSHFHFYTFGWDGKLDKIKREEWAFKLYDQLITEIESIKQRTSASKLTIELLAHSHGGNVALNLAKAEGKNRQNLSIDRLILLGTPVQSETAHYVGSSVFKKVYNMYSRGDVVQVMDIFSTDDDSSKRRFKDCPNLTQIEVTVNKFKPLHTELWFTGTKDNFIYRKKFPLRPLPLFVLSPLITSFIDHHLNSIKNLDLNLNVEDKSDYLTFNFCDADVRRGKITQKEGVAVKNIAYAFHHSSLKNLKTSVA